jgi:hypothetical protein
MVLHGALKCHKLAVYNISLANVGHTYCKHCIILHFCLKIKQCTYSLLNLTQFHTANMKYMLTIMYKILLNTKQWLPWEIQHTINSMLHTALDEQMAAQILKKCHHFYGTHILISSSNPHPGS